MSLADGENGSGGKSAAFIASRIRALHARAELGDDKAVEKIRQLKTSAQAGNSQAQLAYAALDLYHRAKRGDKSAMGAISTLRPGVAFGAHFPTSTRPGVYFGAKGTSPTLIGARGIFPTLIGAGGTSPTLIGARGRFPTLIGGKVLSNTEAAKLRKLMNAALVCPVGHGADLFAILDEGGGGASTGDDDLYGVVKHTAATLPLTIKTSPTVINAMVTRDPSMTLRSLMTIAPATATTSTTRTSAMLRGF